MFCGVFLIYCCGLVFGKIEDIYSSYRPSQVVLSRFFISVVSVHDVMDAVFQ